MSGAASIRPWLARACAMLFFFAAFVAPRRAHAEEPAREEDRILDPDRDKLRIESFDVAATSFSQDGHGYQSQSGGYPGPGSEALRVFEPQAFIVMRQGPRLRYTLHVPLDFVTAASPNAIDSNSPDIVSTASEKNEAGSIDGTATYDVTKHTSATLKGGFHLEEDFRSFNMGLAGTHSFRDDTTTLALGATQIYDWFDHFLYDGHRHGRTQRGTTTGYVSLTQIMTPTTIAYLNYGLTEQNGELGNTWNAVPLASGHYGGEILPLHRTRHALVGRFSQWLPWNGALKGFYRFYADDWGIVAHSFEAQLLQRLTPNLYVRASYRYHTQRGADFFTALAVDDGSFRTADSDLQSLDAHSVGFGAIGTIPTPMTGSLKGLELGGAYERYFRTNDLTVNVFMWRTGFRF